MSSGNYKLKQDITICLLEWPKFRTVKTPNADKNRGQQGLSFSSGGSANGPATLEDRLSVFYKIKHTLTI
jgi:hypothetical protein